MHVHGPRPPVEVVAPDLSEEGRAPGYLFINGRWQDHVLMGLVNPAWRTPPGFLRRTEDGRIEPVPPEGG